MLQELRFVFAALPALTLAAAVGLDSVLAQTVDRLCSSRSRSSRIAAGLIWYPPFFLASCLLFPLILCFFLVIIDLTYCLFVFVVAN